jgi:hypothetical protein
VREPRFGRRLGATTFVAVAAIAAFAVVGGTGLAGGLAKPFNAQYGPGQYHGKVTICHKGKVTLRISVAAWPAHRDRHGDSMGPCSAAAVKAAKLKAAKLKAEHSQSTTHGKGAGKSAQKAKHGPKGHSGSSSTSDDTEDATETHGHGGGHGNGHGNNG